MVVAEQTWADVEKLCDLYGNWNRWGSDDQLGTVNYIEPEKRVGAAGLVRDGRVISCALPYDDKGPQNGAFGRTNPIHVMLQDGGDIALGAQDHHGHMRYTDDAVYMPLQSGTQWDALAHVFHDGRMYNGFGLRHVTSRGAELGSIDKLADRVVTRGVLLDIARWRGQESLVAGDEIDSAELEACAEAEGVEVTRGDAVLVRTGQLGMCRSRSDWGDYALGPAPGLGLDSAHFLCTREVAAVATDTWGAEVRPNRTNDVFQPLHIVLIVYAGMLVGEIFDLEALAEDCARDGRYEFMFVAAPLPITGAVGSPLNPLAIK